MTQDRYREFVLAAREFNYIRNCMTHGQFPSEDMPCRSLATLCPACPQPGINMNPFWMRRPIEKRYVLGNRKPSPSVLMLY